MRAAYLWIAPETSSPGHVVYVSVKSVGNTSTFRRKIKIHLFKLAFPPQLPSVPIQLFTIGTPEPLLFWCSAELGSPEDFSTKEAFYIIIIVIIICKALPSGVSLIQRHLKWYWGNRG